MMSDTSYGSEEGGAAPRQETSGLFEPVLDAEAEAERDPDYALHRLEALKLETREKSVKLRKGLRKLEGIRKKMRRQLDPSASTSAGAGASGYSPRADALLRLQRTLDTLSAQLPAPVAEQDKNAATTKKKKTPSLKLTNKQRDAVAKLLQLSKKAVQQADEVDRHAVSVSNRLHDVQEQMEAVEEGLCKQVLTLKQRCQRTQANAARRGQGTSKIFVYRLDPLQDNQGADAPPPYTPYTHPAAGIAAWQPPFC